MLSAAYLLLPALVALFVVVRSVRTYYGLKAFGGHWSAGWSRLWLLKTQSSGEMHKRFTAINLQYGSTARIGPRMLITTDPDLLRRMSAVRSPFTRGPWYSALKLHPERDNITSHTDERIHADLRMRMAPGYSGKENFHVEQDIDEKILQLFDLISTKYVARPDEGVYRTMDLSRTSSYFTLDVISKIAFGETFGFLNKDDDPFGYIENLKQFLPAIILFGVYSELVNLMKMPLIRGALPRSSDKRGLGRVMGFARDRVQERFGHKPVIRQDMLGSFINRGLTQAELESETLTQITAGSDSTAQALRVVLHFISTSPLILERLIAEINAGISMNKITRPIIKDSEARQLPYLQACIKEGLRIHPPVSGLMAKMVPEGGVMIEVDGVDKFAPTGTQIGNNSWGLMHDPEIFGADCEYFRPERWLLRDEGEKEKQRVLRMTETVTLNFGSGRFGCLGRGVATMELNKAVIETLLRFNLQPCSLAKPFDEMVIGFTVHENMHFIVTERDVDGKASRQSWEGGTDADAGALPGSYDA